MIPGYCSAQTFLNSAPLEVTSGLASSTSTLLRGLACLKYQATWQARS
jgi:hypothetical protein